MFEWNEAVIGSVRGLRGGSAIYGYVSDLHAAYRGSGYEPTLENHSIGFRVSKRVELDSDGDGVPDASDDCPNTIPSATVDANGCPDPPIPNDYNNDGDVGQYDLEEFEACASGPAIPLTPGCEEKDRDTDGDVDQTDFAEFQRCYSGEDNPGDPTCAD